MANRNTKRKSRAFAAKMKYAGAKVSDGRCRLRRGRGGVKTFDNVSLDDMIAASRIVSAYQDGISMEVKFGTDQAKRLAAHIIAQEPKKDTVSHQLNKAIIQRNLKENKPTKRQ